MSEIEHLEEKSPKDRESENPNEEVHSNIAQKQTIESSQLQTSNSKLQTEEMEVHHHPHHVTHKKQWSEYLLEFFMLFVAVFLGFIAENIRENISEHKDAKQLAVNTSAAKSIYLCFYCIRSCVPGNRSDSALLSTISACSNFYFNLTKYMDNSSFSYIDSEETSNSKLNERKLRLQKQ
jgi:hypothetical protein